MFKLYEAESAMEAQLLRDHLASEQIEVVVLGGDLQGAAGELSALVFPVVWIVDERDLARARLALRAFLADRSSGAQWTCACGERLEDSFDLCWRCGRERPDDAG